MTTNTQEMLKSIFLVAAMQTDFATLHISTYRRTPWYFPTEFKSVSVTPISPSIPLKNYLGNHACVTQF